MGTEPSLERPGRPSLSFSVDRILSKEVGPPPPAEACHPIADWNCCEQTVRCCLSQLQPGAHPLQYYSPHHHFLQQAALLHAPKPIRPFPAKFQVKVSYEDSVGAGRDEALSGGKRKRSWSRAVFSSLQRKGLEKRFQLQQYITKPDRRQLAATLGLTDAQVKVWFQNRRMKWRHTKELKGGTVPCQQRLSASSQPQPQERTA